MIVLFTHKSIEEGYQKGEKRVEVDDERFVDIPNLLQRRIDDETKRRPVKRKEEEMQQQQGAPC